MVLKDGKVIAADAKFDVDDNALFRHEELLGLKEEAEEDPIEAEAHRQGVTYVRLPGDIGIMGNGAGIVMGTLDMVTREGGKPANFCDIGGGASVETVRKCLSIVADEPERQGRADQRLRRHHAGRRGRGWRPRSDREPGRHGADRRPDGRHPRRRGSKLLEGSALVPEASPVEAARKIIALAKGA